MKVIHKDGFKVIGIQVVSDWKGLHEKMPSKWNAFKNRVGEISSWVSDKMMDISLKYDGEQFTQIVCVEVKDDHEVPEGMVACFIPKQNYIHYYHTGTLQEIAQSFSKMYTWANVHGYSASEFKIDYGYSKNNSEEGHDLYVKINN